MGRFFLPNLARCAPSGVDRERRHLELLPLWSWQGCLIGSLCPRGGKGRGCDWSWGCAPAACLGQA